ncbi:YraN family protein [Rheinheimera baltica]|uniref:YraN family protein n=1 Tax=Rheinheimera baltica TaxID=67576 RepID=UPI00273F3ABE|nr:YraN family protein [Rheinheimera baltica]MDP5189264.1 YraN family protein [Rheinheimera baltica]
MNTLGQLSEQLALDYLQRQGLTLLQQNFRCKAGEIDLVMQDGVCLVFVEVKYRASNAFGGAAAAVTVSKQQKLLRASRWYLQQHKLTEQACRLDVIAIEGQAPYQYHWIKNAITQ